MKNINKIFTYLLILPLFAISCNQVTELEYEPGVAELPNSYGVYFPVQDASGSHTYDPEMQRSVSVTVARPADKSSDAITVPYKLTASAEGVFEAGEIKFADGQTETKLNVTFDKAEVGTNYSFTIVIDDPAYCYVYGSNPTSFNFSVLIVTWEYILNPKTGEPSLFEITQNTWAETCWGYVKYYEVNGVRTCFLELNGKHVYNGEEYESPDFWGPEGAPGATLQFNIYTNDKNADGNMYVEMLPLEYYFHESYNAMIWMYDYYYYLTVYNPQAALAGLSWIDFAKKYGDSYPLGYYDGNGGLFFYVKGRYMLDIGGWTMDSYDIVGIGEGFTRVDYSLSLESDYPSDGAQPIYVETGKDIKTLKFATYPGELADADIDKAAEAIIAGEAESETFEGLVFDEESAKNYATLQLTPEATGIYTLVVVGLDENGTAQASEAISFNFISGADSEEHAVNLTVGTEDVPARYGDYPNNSSFAFYVLGQNIKEAHIGIYDSATFSENEEAVKATVKAASSNSVTVASSDVIAEINKPGGFYTYTSGLRALTTYVVVVWATNGEMETWETAEYTTAGLPNEFICVGTYAYDAWWSGNDDEQELYKNPNLADTYVLPDWGGGVDFSFTMDADGIITIPTFAIGATHSSYGTVYYVDPFNYWTEEGLASDETRAVHSYYDAETNTYNFHFVLAVSAGSFGHFWETYTPNAEETPAGVVAKVLAKALASNAVINDVDCKFVAPSLELKALPREPKPVKVNVSYGTERKANVSKKDLSAPVESTSKLAL